MDWIRQARERVERQMQSMTPAMRWVTVGLVAAVLVGVVSLSNRRGLQADTFLLSESIPAGQLSAIEVEFAKAGLTDYVVEDRRIKVPAKVKDRYLAALVDAGELPRAFGEITKDAIDAASAFDSREQKAERMRNAKQRELAGIISEMKGIDSARVLYDQSESTGIRRQQILTASVSVTSEDDQPLSLKQVRSIRNLVASAIAGLETHQVSVTDLNTGRNYAGEKITNAFSLAEIRSEHKRTLELQWRQTIVETLNWLPGVDATVDVSLRELEAASDEPTDPQWQPTAARIVLNVPRGYVDKVWLKRQDIPDDSRTPLTPSRDVADLGQELADRLKTHIAGTLPPGIQLDLQMSLFDDVTSQHAKTGSSTADRVMLTSSLPGLIGLTVVAFLGIVTLLWSVRKKPPGIDIDSEPPTADEPTTASSQPLDVDQRLKSAMVKSVNQYDAGRPAVMMPSQRLPSEDENSGSWVRADSRLVPGPQITGIDLNDLTTSRIAPVHDDLPSVADVSAKPFGFLSQASSDDLIELLQQENSQVIAVTFSHLDPTIAAKVLNRLPKDLQVDVVRRMEGMDSISERVTGEIEESLELRFAELMRRSQRRSVGQKAMKQILQAAGTKTRRRISSEINGESGALTKETAAGVDAGHTAPQAPVFEDVLALDDDALRRVIGAADPKDVVLSLAGSERDVIDRVLRNMKPRDASRLRRAFHAIDPLSLTDVNGSQDKIAILAARMDQNGRLRPSSVSTSHA